MFKRNLIFSFVLLAGFKISFSQPDTTGLDQKTKDKLIYLKIIDETTNVYAVESTTGRIVSLADQIRYITIKFRQGSNPNTREQTLSTSGDNLKKLIQNDTLAVQELDRALLCKEQAKNSRTIWKSMQFVTIGALFTGLLIYIINDFTTTAKVFMITGGAAYATLGVFYFRSNIKYNKFIESINTCINVYNNNIISASRSMQ